MESTNVIARVMLATAAIAALVTGGAVAIGSEAHAETVTRSVTKCGHPVSDGVLTPERVKACRSNGWIIRRGLMVSPGGRAFTNIPACEQEDSARCYWNALRQGNRAGRGFVALAGRTVYVDRINGRRASSHLRHQWTVVPVK